MMVAMSNTEPEAVVEARRMLAHRKSLPCSGVAVARGSVVKLKDPCQKCGATPSQGCRGGIHVTDADLEGLIAAYDAAVASGFTGFREALAAEIGVRWVEAAGGDLVAAVKAKTDALEWALAETVALVDKEAHAELELKLNAALGPVPEPKPKVKLTRCESSNVAGYGHDDVENVLYIVFKGGFVVGGVRTSVVYAYREVPRQVFEDLELASSKGTFIAKMIKPTFKNFRKLEGDEADMVLEWLS